MGEKTKRGRPSKFDTHVQPNLDNGNIRRWVLEGKTDVDIAKKLDINYDSWKVYMKEREDFSAIIRDYKNLTNDHVESKLYQNATGYYYEEQTVSNKGEIIWVKKYSKPDVRAQQFWLKNRRREEWRDNHDINIDGDLTIDVKFVAEDEEE
jgi:hypothetical protein